MGSAFFKLGRRDCETVEERLEAYLTGALPEGDERNRIVAHLSDCPECQARVVEYTRVREALSVFRVAPIPERAGDWRSVRIKLEGGQMERDLNSRRPVFSGRSLVTGLAAAMLGVAAVAMPMVHSTETGANTYDYTPIEATRETRNNVPVGQPGSISRMMGYVTVGKGTNTLTAAPTFVGAVPSGVVPLVVEIGSDQNVAEAQLEIRPWRFPGEHHYRYTVPLSGGKSRFLVYPSFGLHVDGNALQACEVTLTAPGRKQTLRLNLSVNPGNWPMVAYVSNRLGAITPRHEVRDQNGLRIMNSSRSMIPPAYVAPENAPDRAIGYTDITVLALSPDAATLNPSQWRAIREWVTAGGHLVLMSDRLLDIPAAAELAPVRKVVRKAFGTTFVPIKGAIEKQVSLPSEMAGTSALLAQRLWGLGRISFTGFDPSTDEFRNWNGCDDFWTNIARGQTQGTFRIAAHRRTVWATASSSSVSQEDAFHLSLPSVQNVLFVFLAYFVLVVPVTFAVLKHTRRLNLAWVSGPVLAAVFAGGIFLLTARLYFMPTARRTTGVLFLHSGERFGRFAGNTELFFPRAGRYDLSIRGADSIEMALFEDERERPLDSLVSRDGTVTTATLSANNLAFRRVHHEQSVDLPGAVTAELQPNTSGSLVGFIENNTGKPLLNAAFSKWVKVNVKRGKGQTFNWQFVVYPLGTVPMGRTEFTIDATKWVPLRDVSTDYLNYGLGEPGTANFEYDPLIPRNPTLLARIPGAAFGPQTGRDFSGEQSVTVMVGLDTQKTGDKQ